MPIINKDGLVLTAGTAVAEAVDCPNDRVPQSILDALESIKLIRIPFPDSSDGRGFSIAQSLRARGYTGHLRACGDLISDQFQFAIDCGFNDVQISDEMLARQPIEHWQYKQRTSYRQRLAA